MTWSLKFFSKQFHLRSTIIISLFIIAVSGLVSISWFQGDFLINGLDRSFPPGRIEFFLRGFSLWDVFIFGADSPRNVAGLFPTNLYLAVSEVIGLSLISAEKLWFYFLFTSMGLSMYFLTTTIYNGKYKQLVGTISALFFMFNPYTIITIVPQMWLYIIFLPLILGLFIKGLKEKRGLKYILIISVIWTLTATSDYANPKYLIFNLVPIFLYLLFHILLNRNKVEFKRSIRFTVALLIVWTALNAFWVIPILLSLNNVIESPLSAYSAIGSTRLISYNLGSAPLSGAFRLLGFWSLDAEYKDYPYAYWASTYTNPLFIIIGFLIPILAFAFLLKRPKNQSRIFFAILAIIGLFIMNGSSASLGLINGLIMKNIPLMVDIFSNPYTFGGMYVTVSFAFLFASFIPDLLESRFSFGSAFILSTKKRKKINILLICLLVFLVIGLYAFPLWTGDVIYPGNPVMASNRYNIPDYYYDAKNWLKNDPSDFRIFPFPYSILGYGAYDWSPAGFNGPDPTELLLGRSLIAGTIGQGIGLETARHLVNTDSSLAKVLSLMNVKYVLIHNDAAQTYLANNTWYITPDQAQIPLILSNQTGFTYERSFGKLDFYLNNYWRPMRVYSASTNIVFDGDIDQLIDLVKRTDFNLNNTIISLSNQLDAQQLSNIPVNIEIVQNSDSSLVLAPFSTVSRDERLILMPNYKPVVEARFYSGWKGVISTNGTGDPGMIVFSSPETCPYLNSFPRGFTNWSAYDSTLLFFTSLVPITINSVNADVMSMTAEAWWQTGTSWGKGWPINIPPYENVVIQISQKINHVTLQTDKGPITVTVNDGWVYPLTTQNEPEVPCQRIMITDPSQYLIAIKPPSNNTYKNVTVQIGAQSFFIDFITQKNQSDYHYIGPVYLEQGLYKLSIYTGSKLIPHLDDMVIYSLRNNESFVSVADFLYSDSTNNVEVSYNRLNPTQYIVNVTTSAPFYLVFSDSYDKGWIASINGETIPNAYHFTANGYANGWYLNKTGTYSVNLQFAPQNYLYAGAAISILSLIIIILYLSRGTLKQVFKIIKYSLISRDERD